MTDFNEFKNTQFNKKIIRHKMKRIQIIIKISSYFDDKRYALNDGIYTLVYFHKDINSHK